MIIYYLNAFMIPRNIGSVSVPDGDYNLGNGNVRQLDAAFITKVRVIDIYQLAPNGGLNVQTFGLDGELDGGDVLPGFTLAVRDIFPTV